MKAIVLRSSKHLFTCYTELHEEKNYPIKKKIFDQIQPIPGDEVLIEGEIISKILPRKNTLTKYSLKKKSLQPVATHVDFAIFVTPITNPTYSDLTLDKIYLRSQTWSIPLLVVINKMDLYTPSLQINPLEISQRIPVSFFELSAKYPEYKNQFLKNGFQELKNFILHKKVLFLGESGVGKSRLISSLLQKEIKTGELSQLDRGKHTTTQIILYPEKDFWIFDTPGFNYFHLRDLQLSDLDLGFPDIKKLSHLCHFHNCEHNNEAQLCFIKDNPHSLVQSRLKNYLKIKKELQLIPSWDKSKGS